MPSTKQRDTVTTEEFFGSYSPDVQAIANALRQLVKATVPEVQERVALGWQLMTLRVGAQRHRLPPPTSSAAGTAPTP